MEHTDRERLVGLSKPKAGGVSLLDHALDRRRSGMEVRTSNRHALR